MGLKVTNNRVTMVHVSGMLEGAKTGTKIPIVNDSILSFNKF